MSPAKTESRPARVLVAEPLSENGLTLLREAGVVVDVRTDLSREALLTAIGEYDGLVVRSATQVDRELFAAGKQLRVVGRAGVGLDNVDVKAATERGVLVVNAPSGNVVSAAEHTVALLLALYRRIPEAQVSLKAGEWKRSKFVGTELQGKTVGLVGLGQVGARVAARLRPWQVRLLGYDPYISEDRAAEMGVTLASLPDLLRAADVVSLHTPVTPDTANLLNAERIAMMKPGAVLVNCARGALVDEAALVKALDDGRLAGAALDVFAVEPPKDFTLARHPKVVATPHLGASTVEAQDRVATETIEMLLEALAGSPFVAAVNLPFPPGGDAHAALPWMRLAERVGEFTGQALQEAPVKITVALSGVPEGFQRACIVAAVKGVLKPFCAEGVNLVNAQALARARGVTVVEEVKGEGDGYSNLVRVAVSTGKAAGAPQRSAAGTLFGDRHGRVVAVDELPLEFVPEGTFLVIANRDVPGVVGRIGTLLGEKNVNIGDFALARGREGRAAAVVRVDEPISEPMSNLVAALGKLPGIESVRCVAL